MNEPTIREWFSQFGPLNQILIDPAWGKAILVYKDYDSAAKAWNDPRPVFSNRFVKIWWKKTDASTSSTLPATTSSSTLTAGTSSRDERLSGGIIDQVELEIAREAAVKAQKEHEEKQRRKEELEKKKEELERQRVELMEKQRLERERLMEKIRKAEENAKDKVRGVINSATPATTEKNLKEEVSGEKVPEESPVNGDDRKAHLQKMLSDLQNQVL